MDDRVTKILGKVMVILLAVLFALSLIVAILNWSIIVLLSTALAATVLIWFCKLALSRRFLKGITICVLTALITTTPVSLALTATANQSVAGNIATQQEIVYFQDLLDRRYNYTELIQWENQHLNFTNDLKERNSDPIKILEYDKGMCIEFAILYAELAISQGYHCRIVVAPLNDHAWNEVEIGDQWVRVDSSLGINDTRAIGYPMFFEKEKGWNPPVIALAFEDSSIVDVTATYRSDHWSVLLSPLTYLFALIAGWFSFCIHLIWRKVRGSNGQLRPKRTFRT